MSAQTPWVEPGLSSKAVGDIVAGGVLRHQLPRAWWIATAVSFALTLVFIGALFWSFIVGPGLWGNNTSQVWGFAIANYVFWLGVGHAGTLISSLLWLTRQRWRAAVNRYAEAMTLVAVCIAGLFPIVHLGRPMYVLWVAPLPMHEGIWPQWRSPLVWDFWAVSSYLLFSALFFYTGLMPDLATMRDKARHRLTAQAYGAFALGWRGSAGHWRLHRAAEAVMSSVAVPLVVSVHSIVGLDFAASLMPAWNTGLYPAYFVVGAMYSGFATTALLGMFLRWALALEMVIRPVHFDTIARVMLAASLVMGLSYGTEWFGAWLTGGRDELRQLMDGAFGAQGWVYWSTIGCNVLAPQLFWLPRVRMSLAAVAVVSLLIDLGMWLERYQLVTGPLGHNFMPATWRTFQPQLVDWLLTAGAIGFFCFAILMIARIVPIVSIHGTRKVLSRSEKA